MKQYLALGGKAAMVAMVATSFATISAPAMAEAVTPIADMTAVCLATQIQPAPNSRFEISLNTSSIVGVTGPEFEQSRVTIQDIPGGVLLSSTPPTYVAGSQGRNGQSPNIFGSFKSTLTYSGGSKVQQVTYAATTDYTYGCTVSKTNLNNGNVTIPPGLQVNGLTMSRTNVTRVVTETTSNPNVVVESLSEAVICNSPTRNPGVWRNQNGYTGECSTRLFLSLSQIVIHSVSLPPLVPVNAPEDFVIPNSDEQSGPATVIDTETDA